MPLRGAAVLALVIVAGCGGSEPLTRRAYLAQADAVCEDAEGRWQDLDPPVVDDPVTEEEYLELVVWDMKTGVGVAQDVLGELDDLRPPVSLEADAERMISALGRLIDVMDAYAAAAEAHNEAELQRLEEEAPPDADEAYRRAARKVGLTSCAKGWFMSSWRPGSVPQATQEPLDLEQPPP